MDKREWRQIEDIVNGAMERQGKERARYINEQCRDNKQLKKQVTEYLNAIEQSEGFLENDDDVQKGLLISDYIEDPDNSASSLIGEIIGNYKITELLGYGGLGSVFLAERADGEFQHQVALKVLRRGMDTPKNISRFQLEREILAELSHPNIAQLYDGGVTKDGLPYLIMEYIDGTPIDSYCNQHKLSIKQRLSLFEDICNAVQYAHNNLIIHRDLKPANIMVTEAGDVKILDFGISKLIRQDTGQSATQTQESHQMLTPGYAAPEQLTQQSITTAIDNYALGGLLYKLLVGVTLFDLKDKRRSEIESIITGQIPLAPSKRFQLIDQKTQNDIAESRKLSPDQLVSVLEGDLDAIVLKAVRKEKEGRYESPNDLIKDIKSYQSGRPVTARSNRLLYRLSKFVKRNRAAISATVLVILSIAGFFSYHTYQVTKERDKVQLEAQKAEAVTNFLTDLIEANAPENTQGDTVTVREFLESGFQEVQDLDETPAVQAEILTTMGHTYRSLGEIQKASTLINDALEIQEKQDIESKDMARSYNIYGIIQRDMGNYDNAQEALRHSVKMYRSAEHTNTGDYTKALRDLSYVERLQANYQDAYELAREALEIERDLYEAPDIRIAETLYVLASILRYQNQYDEAIKFQKKSLNMVQQLTDGPHPGVGNNMVNLANLYGAKNNIITARKYYLKALEINKKLYGDVHRSLANIHSSLSSGYRNQEKLDSAQYHSDQALQIQKKVAPDNPQMAAIFDNRARLFAQKGELNKADSLLNKSESILKDNFKKKHPRIVEYKISKAKIERMRGNLQNAENIFQEVLQIRKEKYDIDEEPVQDILYQLTDVLEKSGQQAKADSLSQYIE